MSRFESTIGKKLHRRHGYQSGLTWRNAFDALLSVVAFLVFLADPTCVVAASPAGMIERLLPGVVRITVHKLESGAERADAASFGSGFIIDRTGYVVTNQHVVDGAYEIVVTLNDGTIHHAKLIGTGRDVDLAVLKIEAAQELQPLAFGDSNEARIGDEVFAIGNPYGIGTTVTRGIISAVNRDLNRSMFDSYIQTDAAINRGNSGGPLVSGNGEVVGVNTAYYRGLMEKSGSIGLGFAIPSAVVKSLVDLIRQYGYPKIGWLGVDGQSLTTEMASALGLNQKTGALLISVRGDGPSAGLLEPNDVILSINDTELIDMRMLQRAAAGSLGRPVKLAVLRQDKLHQLIVTPTERPLPQAAITKHSYVASVEPGSLGLALSELSDSTRRELNMAANAPGVFVSNTAPISPAAEAGISKNDVIESVQLRPVYSANDVVSKLSAVAARNGNFAVLRIRSRDDVRFVTLHMIWEGPSQAPRKQ